MIDNIAQAQAAVGQEIQVRGRAENGKAAALVVGDDLVIYCLDRDSWPDDIVSREVEVRGVLEQSEELRALVSEDGAISQGTEAAIFALRVSRYQTIADPE